MASGAIMAASAITTRQAMKGDLYAEVSARIVAELEAGAAPWVKPWSATPGANTPCNAPVASRWQRNGSCSRRTGTFRRQRDTNPAGDGSYRLKNSGLGQPGQCNSQVDRSRAVARN